ncbi:MAG: hypothetical protein AAGK93_09365 [Pseudomonadota bacterium]
MISGTISFDAVPLRSDREGLDYADTVEKPVRGVVVQAVDFTGIVQATGSTDEAGQYALTVPSLTDVRIQVQSKMVQSGTPGWDVEVLDNTSDDALYILTGQLVSSGDADSTRNLHAPSGWDPDADGGDGAYTSVRAAAPFSILDTMYLSLTKLSTADDSLTFPLLEVFWSRSNVPIYDDFDVGEVGGTYFSPGNSLHPDRIVLLGAANLDTDEYDNPVVAHEFAHFIQEAISRDHSMGGPWGLTSGIDPRLAFSEGWANAFSAIVLDDTYYYDTFGPRQQRAFGWDIELDQTSSGRTGWYSPASVQQIMYDLYDSEDDGADTISLGLGPLIDAFTDPEFIQGKSLTTIYSFVDRLKANAPPGSELETAIDALMTDEEIFGTGPFGKDETNAGALSSLFPAIYDGVSPFDVFRPVVVDGPAMTICSSDDIGTYNRLGVRSLLVFELDATTDLIMQAVETSPLDPGTDTDPDFIIYENGVASENDSRGQDRLAESEDDGEETWVGTLDAGTYVIDFYDYDNWYDETSEDSCFDFTVAEN